MSCNDIAHAALVVMMEFYDGWRSLAKEPTIQS